MKTIIKNLKLVLVLFTSSLLLQSCLLDDDAVDYGDGRIVVQFSNLSITENFLQTDENIVYTYEIPVSIFGGRGVAIDSDVDFTVSADPASTATEGQEFRFSNGTEFTIPAGETSTSVTIEVLSENLDSSDPAELILQIDSSSEVVSDNNKTSLILQAVCPSDLGGAYKYSDGNGRDVTITETGTGTYEISRDNAFSGVYPIYFSDVCGNLSITGTYLTDNFGIPTSGTASLNPDTGVITIVYTAEGYFSNRTMTLVPQ